ncbi:hypothetical protein [Thermococcus sp.]
MAYVRKLEELRRTVCAETARLLSSFSVLVSHMARKKITAFNPVLGP